MSEGLNPSRFSMWRAVVSMMHADFVVKPHEINFILESLRDLPLSPDQHKQLMEEIYTPAVIDEAFHAITSPIDKEDFFHLARALAWADGDFDETEQQLIERLADLHFDIADKSILTRSRKDFDLYMADNESALASHDPATLGMIKKLLGR